ncbi:MAG: sensor signal transduction histidine kinase [Symbiobacteriaceae bacterium]|nr:sensor signal transduction histidine kinase [Symbiobacteriaceae bacterium]
MLLRRYGGLALGALVLIGFWALSLISYLLFHTTVEITSMVVSFCIFTLAWNQRRTMDNGYLLFVGLASIFIGIVDLLHAMTYKGMGVFPSFGADPPTQLWIAGRIVQTLTFLAAPFFLNRKVRTLPVMATYTVLTALLCWSVFAGVFPACYIDGVGLTPFKKVTEYVVSLLLAVGLYLFRRRKEVFDPLIFRLMTWTIALTIVGELAFTLYSGVTDQFNLLGHLIRLVSYCLLYLATVQTGLTKPFSMLFRNLKQSEEALQKERNFVSGVLDSAGALMTVADANGLIIRFNRACEELSGYKQADVVGRRLVDFLTPPEDRAEIRRAMIQLQQGRSPAAFEGRWILANGSSRWISWTISLIHGEDGKVQYVVGSGLDITERRQAEAELKEREERLRMMVDSVQTGMLLVDKETHAIVSANPAAAALIGLPPEAIVSRSCSVFIKCAGPDGACPLATTGQAPLDAVLKTFDGRDLPIHRTAVAVTTDGRQHLMESFVDMSAQKLMEEELRSLSMIDELTGLYNRRGFLTLAPKEMAAADRVGGSVALLMVDISGLKEINDAHGHAEGDRVLIAMAHILREAFSESKLIARFGSDEFAVLAPQFVGARPSMLVDRLERLLEDYNTTNSRDYEIRVNTGVARTQPQKPSSVHDLMNQADNALYVEKRRRVMAR